MAETGNKRRKVLWNSEHWLQYLQKMHERTHSAKTLAPGNLAMANLRDVTTVLGCMAFTIGVNAASIIHVDPNDSIQAAIDQARDGDEIVVAPGTYVERIDLLGKAITLHSSEGPEVTILDGDFDLIGWGSVITCENGEDPNTVIMGFTITKGTGHSYGEASVGGGMYNDYNSSPTISNCIFINNSATADGGGMWNGNGSCPTITDCTFIQNWIRTGYSSGGCFGGGVSNARNSSPTLINCAFIANTACSGGGMHNGVSSKPTLINCTLVVNSAERGGGISNDSRSSPRLFNCVFNNNTADNHGGGMYNYYKCNPTLVNCTFSGNSAVDIGGGIYSRYDSRPTLANCILWGNMAPTGPQLNDDPDSTTTAFFSCIADGWLGVGNLNSDPLFVDPNGPDGIAGTLDDDLRLQPGSPCIDAGISLAGDFEDLDGNYRTVNDPNTPDTGFGSPVTDMGAYEFGSTPLRDFDADLDVDLHDVAIFQLRYTVANVLADLDQDNAVDGDDFVICQQRITGPQPQP